MEPLKENDELHYGDILKPRQGSMTRKPSNEDVEENSPCFYSLCDDTTKKRTCGKLYCVWPGFRFRDKNHHLMYQITVWIVVLCVVSVALPLVSIISPSLG